MLKELEKYRVPQNFTGKRLQDATQQIIDSWVALQLAFDHQTLTIQESPDNVRKMLAYQLTAYIYNCETDIDDIVQFFSVYLDQYLQLVIEDNSDRYIAQRLLEVFQDLENDKEEKYLQLLEDVKIYKQQNQNIKHVVNDDSDNEQDGDIQDDDEQDDQQQQQTQQQTQQQPQQQTQQPQSEDDVDSDGYELVKPKKRNYKRN